MDEHGVLRGTPVRLADGSTVRVRTIPFSPAGYELARKLDALAACEGGNEALLDLMLDVCLDALRLNYPGMEREKLAERLDLESARAVIAALRGEAEEEI
ncbi:MAG: hypothetical protein DRP90_04550 [Planctomycetota bacterium]|nr:MAG: hypothetical protein DRP90_04550 [Planctomycetota bacterium]